MLATPEAFEDALTVHSGIEYEEAECFLHAPYTENQS